MGLHFPEHFPGDKEEKEDEMKYKSLKPLNLWVTRETNMNKMKATVFSFILNWMN